MKTLKLLLAGIVVGVVVVALRDRDFRGLLAPARPGGNPDPVDPEEPVLGYDGMDQDTLIDWLGAAALDGDTLTRIAEYERANRGREQVLLAVNEMMG